MVYEGAPSSPNEYRHFEIVETYDVTVYYTVPALMKWGRAIPDVHDSSSL
jgi:acetyl-CoA synthetase